ncbi:MAG: FKBP-type peptidyl-prolyl cis-trans isomerase [Muribaculaceae bacterium]|nr:FKBP-type peptidyl-prolyl cis-trans isomerase [Muribaculaceae bacterium]
MSNKKNNEEKVGAGKYVEYSYRLYDDADGSLLFETEKDRPDFMVYGVSHEIVPGLVEVMRGLKAGDKFEITLPPAAAFGEASPEYLMELDKEIFMRDGKLADEVTVGASLPMMTAEGFRVLGRVLEVGDKIKMDFNHPFAGKTVRYEGEVELVRDATADELKPTGCGCGGCGGGDCGEGCGSDCGSNCEGCH